MPRLQARQNDTVQRDDEKPEGQRRAGHQPAGNVLHVCGVWSGSAGQQWIVGNNSGSSGNLITIRFETGAALKAPYHSSSGAIQINGSYYLIDGGSNGLIQNTLNGTSGYAGLSRTA